MPEWTFADKFRKARQTTGMDQREFAAALDLTPSTVASYETGRSNPRFRVAADLAKRLQMLTRIDYRWFLDVGGSMPPAPDDEGANHRRLVPKVAGSIPVGGTHMKDRLVEGGPSLIPFPVRPRIAAVDTTGVTSLGHLAPVTPIAGPRAS